MLNNLKSGFLFPTQVVSGTIKILILLSKILLIGFTNIKTTILVFLKYQTKSGWQSLSKEVFTEESFEPFKGKIIPCVTELTNEFCINQRMDLVQMWLNINGPNSYNVSHRHPNCELGVLWIKQTPEQGRFVFDNMDVGYRDAMLLNATDRRAFRRKKNAS